jgi:DNA polymerase-3 subunit alpha
VPLYLKNSISILFCQEKWYYFGEVYLSKFVHLHTHSHYSLLDGLGKIPDLVLRAKELGMDALALTDHGVMYGAIEFYKECQKLGIKPIIGVEAYIAPRKMTDKETKADGSPYHLILLSKNEAGYKNLMKITTAAHLEGYYYKPRVDKEFLKNHSEGLIALSACLGGEIPTLIQSNQKERLIAEIKSYQDIFGQDFYLELQCHPEWPEQQKINKKLIELGKNLGVQLVATNDIHYVNYEDKDAHEILLAVQTGKNYDDQDRMTMKAFNLSMLSGDEMAKNFSEIPEALKNTAAIADQCNLKIALGQNIMPKFPVPKKETAKTYLEKLCFAGAKNRYGEISPKAKERLNYELSVIEKCHFEDYFLIVSDYVNFAKENGILVGPGRGSAAGSIVAYVLGVTDLDPLEYDLLFERFLNPERISPPDIDLDFADDRRSEVITYITDKYGADHVAQIITFGVMKARMAIRDVTRALGMSYEDGDRIAKLIPMGLTLDEALNTISELKSIYDSEPNFTKLIDMAKRLENVARNAGTHAAGVVISQKPLVEYTPLQHPPRGEENLVTQYSMNYLDAIGLLKVDILGLANLTIINNALRIIRKIADADLDLTKIPLDDKKTFELLAKPETSGVFQLESDGMKRYLKELKPTTFEDILSMVALYRPGPMDSIPDYISAKHGKKKITYLDPKLKPILERTYGVIVTQDQVLQIARSFAGFSYAQADILRKAVGKKIRKLLDEQKEKFIQGAIKNGSDQNTAKAVWDFIEPFARYGFNRAHAACYAMISYQTAYLKAHYPSAFMASWLTSEQQDIDKVAFAVSEAKAMGIEVLPPQINESFVEFGVVKASGNIRFGLAAIKNVGEGVSESIVEERKNRGPYLSLSDFLRRLGPKILNKKVIEALAKSGALDDFAERNQILSNLEKILKFISDLGKIENQSQMDLFANATAKPKLAELDLQAATPADKKQKLAWEKELLGMYISEHPLKGMEKIIANSGIPISSLNLQMNEKQVQIAGLVINSKKILTKKGEPMMFVNIEDGSGKIEVIVFPRVLEANPSVWISDNILKIKGRLNNKDGILKIIAMEASPVKEEENAAEIAEPEKLLIFLPAKVSKEDLAKIKEILARFPGQLPMVLHLPKNGGYKEVKTKTRVVFDKNLAKELTLVLPEAKISFV